jgi:hypothetical protein
MDVRSELNDLLPFIKDKYKVKKIGLFGSYSTGNPHEDSDIDLLVEFEEVSFDNYMGLYFFMKDHFQKEIDLLTPTGMNKRFKPYIMEQVVWIPN